MLTPETLEKLLTLAEVEEIEHEKRTYTSRPVHAIIPPERKTLNVSTLRGLVDLYAANLDGMKEAEVLVHVASSTLVQIIAKDTDDWGRLRVYASASYPDSLTKFSYGTFLDPERFIIAAHICFQRVKVEADDGAMCRDLDYILKIASAITAGKERTDTDSGIAQTVQMKAGVTLKSEETLRGRVNLAPYRTFSEIDQVLSEFVFRAHGDENGAQLALFEADGGRWRLAAVAAIVEWLKGKFDDVPIIS